MRKKNSEITDSAVLEDIIRSSTICRVAMIDKGRPYLLPFNYGYRDNHLYIHSAAEGKKMDILSKNPEVCFEIEQGTEIIKGDKACAWTTSYRSVVGYATALILNEPAQKQTALEIIMAQHGAPELTEFKPKNLEEVRIIRFRINSMTGKQASVWNKLHNVR